MNDLFKGVKNLIAFLTMIPVGIDDDCLTYVGRYAFLFPLVGAFIGCLAGFFALFCFQFLPRLLVGTMTLGFILMLVGIQHTDGLMDFGDGLACHGSSEQKIAAMHDQRKGCGALALGLIVLMSTAISIAELVPLKSVVVLTVSEVSAKLAMVTGAWAGRPVHHGMGSCFIKAMNERGKNRCLAIAFIISAVLAYLLLSIVGILILGIGILTSLIIAQISNKQFKGVTGDVLGAINDMARMTSLLASVFLLR